MKSINLAKRYSAEINNPMSDTADMVNMYDDIINFSLGDPDIITNKSIIESAFNDACNGYTRYAQPNGDPELIEEIIKYYKSKYNMDLKPSEIMVVVGACHGTFLALEAILDEGDEVIVHAPYFTPYKDQIKLAKGKIVILETTEEEGFNVNVNKLKNLITKRTKAIILNAPNNPTGAYFKKDKLVEIAQIAKDNDIVILSDEVYDAFIYDGEFCPFGSIEGMKEVSITLGSFSKDFCMTGWRIGYVIAPDNVINAMRSINEGVCFSAPTISQRAALHALRSIKDVQPAIIEEFKERISYAYKRINDIPSISVLKPVSGIYLFINIKKTGLSSSEFCNRLLKEAHILAIPGNAFGDCGEGYVRLACTVKIKELEEAFNRIEKMKF